VAYKGCWCGLVWCLGPPFRLELVEAAFRGHACFELVTTRALGMERSTSEEARRDRLVLQPEEPPEEQPVTLEQQPLQQQQPQQTQQQYVEEGLEARVQQAVQQVAAVIQAADRVHLGEQQPVPQQAAAFQQPRRMVPAGSSRYHIGEQQAPGTPFFLSRCISNNIPQQPGFSPERHQRCWVCAGSNTVPFDRTWCNRCMHTYCSLCIGGSAHECNAIRAEDTHVV
jgi:hypothetical protein